MIPNRSWVQSELDSGMVVSADYLTSTSIFDFFLLISFFYVSFLLIFKTRCCHLDKQSCLGEKQECEKEKLVPPEIGFCEICC